MCSPRGLYDSRDIFEDGERGSLGEVDSQEADGGLGDVPGGVGQRRQSSVPDMAFGLHVQMLEPHLHSR